VSGPYDKPDDPEDVTLWAGRLRPWPAPTAPSTTDDDVRDGIDDATVTAPRGVARHDEAIDDDDTVIVPRGRAGEGVADDTVIVSRERPDDTVALRRERAIDRPVAEADAGEVDAAAADAARVDAAHGDAAPGAGAQVAGAQVNVAQVAGAQVDAAQVGPAQVGPGEGDPVEDTAPADRAAALDRTVRSSRPRTPQEPEHPLDDTTTAARGRAESLGATAPGRRRAAGAGAVVDGRADVASRRMGTDVVTREADTPAPPRQPGAPAPSPSVDAERSPREDVRPREARVPRAEDADTYGPRRDEAVRVHRSAPATRADPDRDAALVRPKAPRRGAARPLVIGGTAVVVLAGALAGFVLLVR